MDGNTITLVCSNHVILHLPDSHYFEVEDNGPDTPKLTALLTAVTVFYMKRPKWLVKTTRATVGFKDPIRLYPLPILTRL